MAICARIQQSENPSPQTVMKLGVAIEYETDAMIKNVEHTTTTPTQWTVAIKAIQDQPQFLQAESGLSFNWPLSTTLST
jgi:hypothetical protein